MELILDVLSWILLIGGAFFGITGATGTLRFPDFYTRVHAGSVSDTLCALMIIAGLVLQAGFTLITVKLIMMLAFLWYTSSAASHALIRAAHHMGVPPVLFPSSDSSSEVSGLHSNTHEKNSASSMEVSDSHSTREDSSSKP